MSQTSVGKEEAEQLTGNLIDAVGRANETAVGQTPSILEVIDEVFTLVGKSATAAASEKVSEVNAHAKCV